MQVEQLQWVASSGWNRTPKLDSAMLVIYFAGRSCLADGDRYHELREFYPDAQIIGCSTGGEIYNDAVLDDSISVLAIHFAHTYLNSAVTTITNAVDAFGAGKRLADQLIQPDLRYVFVLSDGTNVNGSELIRGLYSVMPESVIVTGGLAGDGADFKQTTVGLNAAPKTKQIAAIGFYGDALRVGYGSVGGWKTFGPTWNITRSASNILYELDGKPALDLYKIYLGEDAHQLPKNALLYPFNMRPDTDSAHDIVRTIVNVDEAEKSLIFAGDVPEGYIVRLMRGEFSQLIDGAASAAALAYHEKTARDSVAILVSCIGRKLLLGASIHHETQAIAKLFHNRIPTIGFYSYGEICHQEFSGKCGLHNQTMTVTMLYEEEPVAAPAE